MKAKRYLIILFIVFFSACKSEQKDHSVKIGFGKADLTQAAILEDPEVHMQEADHEDKYAKEEKFYITDRVKGMWRTGSGVTRKLVDSLFVSAMYGEDTNGPWAIIALDEIFLDYKVLDNLQAPLINKLQIPRERLVFLPSHGHAIPKMNPEKYQAAVFEAVRMAKENQKEVEVASLNLMVEGKRLLINRRVDVDGIGTHTVMFNSGCIIHEDHIDATDQVKDWLKHLGAHPVNQGKNKKYITEKEVENMLQAIFFRDKISGKMLGCFTRWPGHAVIVSSKVTNGDVSADYPGYMKRKLEKELGGISLFAQGPGGDIRPLNKEYSHLEAETYGKSLSEMIIDAYDQLTWTPLKELKYYHEPIKIPLKENLFLSKEEIENRKKEIETLYDNEKDPRRRRVLQNQYWGLYRAGGVRNYVRPEWKASNQLAINLYGLKINDQAVIATHGEMFHSIGQKMIEPYKDKNPFILSIANEYISYIPSEEERPKGGYEPSVAIVTPESPQIFINSARKLLSRMYSEENQLTAH